TNRLGNGYSGIYFGDWGVNGDAPSQSTIGGTTPGSGNVISANGNFGVWITGAEVTGVVVEGNKIGTDVTGTYALGNSYQGVQIDSGAVDNTIGGTSAGAGNVVSGNGECGFSVDGVGTSGNLIEGNLVGTDVTGSQPLGNAFQGMYFGPGTTGNTIGGTTAGSGNVISANGNGGIWINGASDDVVEGNMIGTDATGTLALGNAYSGVYVDAGASGNTIGGTTAGSGNVISGNHNYGVVITGQGTNQNVITGNKIGTDVSGWTYALGNSFDGVYVDAGASDNTIGGTTSGNVIAFNAGNGVTIGDNATDASTGDTVLENSIFANARLGIDLGNDGITLNDSKGHSGPNLFQDFPVLSSAFLANGSTTITGTLSASPNTTYRVEFFSSVVADASGYGQGQTFLTFADVTTDGSGTASFSVQTPTAVAAGLFISATATDPNGNTSEFSADIVNSRGPSPPSHGQAGAGTTNGAIQPTGLTTRSPARGRMCRSTCPGVSRSFIPAGRATRPFTA
ncbi:MAG TPA: right-handed parallel beta-helix repeat-containing protein, partial [Isosphaeraceae bacterium]|nr:right-handed parallel beta-helix repeat-containing protein [Isosphaeraceae bacterium]